MVITKAMKIGIPIGTIFMLLLIGLLIAYYVKVNFKNKKQNSIGFRFENKIKSDLQILAKDRGFKFVDGGLFRYSSNNYFEIDGILIAPKAIFIVETKCYDGSIQGNAAGKYLNITKNGKVRKLKNPLSQNLKHIQHFYKLCDLSVPIFSLIIFPEGTTYDFDNLDSFAVIANENNILEIMDEVEKDMKDDAEISNDEIKIIMSKLQSARRSSIKDLKRFGKVVSQNGK